MKGYKRERSPGVWEFTVDAPRDPVTGRRVQRYRTFRGPERGRNGAEAALARFVAEVAAEHPPTDDGASLDQVMRAWLARVERDRAPDTHANYLAHVDAVWSPQLGHVRLRDLKGHHIQAVLDAEHSKGNSAATAQRKFATLRSCLNEAVKQGLLKESPCRYVIPPRAYYQRPQIPSVEDMLAILDAATDHDAGFGMVMRVAAATGVRRGELCGLRWMDVDWQRKLIRVRKSAAARRNPRRKPGDPARRPRKVVLKDTKTHAERSVAIDDGTLTLLSMLYEHVQATAEFHGCGLAPEAHVFSRLPDGSEPLHPDWVTRTLAKVCKEVGLKATPHKMRHLYASIQLSAGVKITAVSRNLGHRRTSTTHDIYDHVLAGDDVTAEVMGGVFTPLGTPVRSARPAALPGETVAEVVPVRARSVEVSLEPAPPRGKAAALAVLADLDRDRWVTAVEVVGEMVARGWCASAAGQDATIRTALNRLAREGQVRKRKRNSKETEYRPT